MLGPGCQGLGRNLPGRHVVTRPQFAHVEPCRGCPARRPHLAPCGGGFGRRHGCGPLVPRRRFRARVRRDDAIGAVAANHGRRPDSVGLHAAVAVDGDLVCFGGGNKQGEFSDEAYLLDTAEWGWTRIDVGDGPRPAPLGGMCAAPLGAMGSGLVLFGGAEMRGDYDGGKGLFARAETWALHLAGGKGEWNRLLQEDESSPHARVAGSLTALPSEVD